MKPDTVALSLKRDGSVVTKNVKERFLVRFSANEQVHLAAYKNILALNNKYVDKKTYKAIDKLLTKFSRTYPSITL